MIARRRSDLTRNTRQLILSMLILGIMIDT